MTDVLSRSLADVTRSEVEDLLYREAELLDDWELDAWLDLYTQDARYVIPCNDDPAGDHPDPPVQRERPGPGHKMIATSWAERRSVMSSTTRFDRIASELPARTRR